MRRKVIRVMGVTITSVVATAFMSCSNDLFTEFDFESPTTLIDLDDSVIVLPYGNYLDLDTSNIKNWTEPDLLILDEAEQRMGVHLSETGLFETNHIDSSAINVSGRLFKCIVDNYQFANNVMRARNINNQTISRRKILRQKSRNAESSNPIPNCVPIAVSVSCNVSYDRAVQQCNYEDPDWMTTGGVDASHIASIMTNLGKSVTTLSSSSSIRQTYGDTIVNINAVMIYPSNPKLHAVNAYMYDGKGTINKVFYNDFQNKDFNNWMAVYAINCMFVCQ